MKNTLPLLIIMTMCFNVFGQKTEFSLRMNSGLFNFIGESSKSTEQFNYNLDKESGYTNSPYGNKFGLTYGLSVNLARITKSNFKFGLDFGYEMLRSKVNIDKVWQLGNDAVNESVDAEGQTYLNLNFINVYPSLGYRLTLSKFIIDFEGGVDIGYNPYTYEKGYAKSGLREFKTKKERSTINMDIRPRFQVGISKDKYGVYLGYSKGLINYQSGIDGGGIREVYSNMFRFGITYKIK